jgi:VanZ family protein
VNSVVNLNVNSNKRPAILALWAALTCCVVVGSLLPAASPALQAIGRLHINDKILHFTAYLTLSSLPVLEAGQHFSPGRAVELNDLLANAAGVATGVLLSSSVPLRALRG